MIYYANYPSKLVEHFTEPEDLRDALAIMGLIASYVNTKTGEFFISIRHIKEKLGIKKHKIEKILKKFQEITMIENTGKKKGHSFIYRLKTYNQEVKEISDKNSDKNSDTLSIDTQGFEPISQTEIRTKIRTQTNNNITNNEITNNEIKEEEKQKIDFGGGGGENLEIENEELINEVELKREIDHLIAIYPKKIANFTRLNERYFKLRIYHALSFKHIKEAVENYMLENDGIDTQFLKNLDNLLVYEELHPFLFKPVIAVDKEGKRIPGEFCISSKVFRFETPTGIKQVVFDNEKFEEMIEQGRLIFRELEQTACVN